MYLFDSWAWIELLHGGSRGGKIRALLQSRSPVYTSKMSVAEISVWAEKYSVDKDEAFSRIGRLTSYLDLEFDLLRDAGRNYFLLRKTKKDIGLIDAIIYTCALKHGLILVTGDPDMEGLPNVLMV